MEKWQGKVALVTGASKGIGREIAKALSLNKLKVVACARSVDKLKSLQEECAKQGCHLDPQKCDNSKMMDVINLYKYIAKTYGTIHVCVNNAGVGFPDRFLPKKCTDNLTQFYERPAIDERLKMYNDWEKGLQVNVLSLSISCKEAINIMVRSGVKDGVIVNIGSILGKFVILFKTKEDETGEYFEHMYDATKWAVTAMCQCIRQELAAKHPEAAGIRVTNICPCWVKTNFPDTFLKGEGQESSSKDLEKFFSNFTALEISDVVEAVFSTLRCASNVQLDEIVLQAVKTPK